MEKPVSILVDFIEKGGNLIGGRCTGNSTRLIDHAVQLLFEGKEIIVHDAWEYGKHKHANENLFERIIRRMSFEHQDTKLKINKQKLILRII